jgi:hypothetical protein
LFLDRILYNSGRGEKEDRMNKRIFGPYRESSGVSNQRPLGRWSAFASDLLLGASCVSTPRFFIKKTANSIHESEQLKAEKGQNGK